MMTAIFSLRVLVKDDFLYFEIILQIMKIKLKDFKIKAQFDYLIYFKLSNNRIIFLPHFFFKA